MVYYTILSFFFAGMIFFFVLPNQPGMVKNEVDWVRHIVVNVTNDVDDEDEKLENTILDVIANSLQVLRCHFVTYMNDEVVTPLLVVLI